MRFGLHGRVLLGFGVALLPIVGFIAYEARSEREWLEATEREQLLRVAGTVALTLDRQFEAAIEIAEVVAASGAARGPTRADVDAFLADLLDPPSPLSALVVFDGSGSVLGFGCARPGDYRPSETESAPILARVREVDGPVVLNAASTVLGRSGVVAAVPLRGEGGRADGAVLAFVDTELLEEPYEWLHEASGAAVLATDPDRRLTIHTHLDQIAFADAFRGFAPLEDALEGGAGTAARFRSPVLGDDRLGGFARSPVYGWGVGVTVPRDRALAPLRARQEVKILALLASAGLTVALAVVITGLFVRPLHRVAAAAKALGHGDLRRRVRVEADDEIAMLGQTFNEMADRLQERDAALQRSEAELRAFSAELEARVEARTRELESINRELEAFSYSVSHDLRAPLRAVEGFVAATLEDHRGALPPDAVVFLERARAGAVRMSGLIDGLLALSRAARAPLTRVWVDMTALARDVGEEVVAASGRAVELRVGALPAAWGDPVLLRQVLSNLIGNAVKYTRGRDPARIEVGYQPGPPGTWFVRDNGIGFDPSRAERLFQPFQRLEQPREFEGSGIGLAIVQRVIARHGGQVCADATPGEGAMFAFTLGGAPEPPTPTLGNGAAAPRERVPG